MFPIKLNISLILCVFLSTVTSAQEITKSRLVVTSKADRVINARISIYPKKINLNKNLYYQSFHNNEIHQTQGDYTGHLLHGDYEVKDKNHRLISKGKYYYGLKDGTWKHWNPTGTLQSSSHWKRGRQHGISRQYNKDGQLVVEEQYRKGKLHGSTKYYNNGELTAKVKFRKGKEKTKRIRKRIFKKSKDESSNIKK